MLLTFFYSIGFVIQFDILPYSKPLWFAKSCELVVLFTRVASLEASHNAHR